MGGTTYLDNSLVYWGNELGFNHIGYSVPCLLAGSAGGFIKPGRYLDYIDWDGKRLLRAGERQRHQGHPAQPVPGDRDAGDGARPRRLRDGGKAGYGSTSASGRDPACGPIDYDLATVGQILPGIRP